jgi:hypothetical protein
MVRPQQSPVVHQPLDNGYAQEMLDTRRMELHAKSTGRAADQQQQDDRRDPEKLAGVVSHVMS